jgi:hypothetical protein
MPKEIKEEIAEDIKEEFMKLLLSLQGVPADKQPQLNSLVEAVRNHDIPKDVRTHLSLVLALFICGTPHGLPQLMLDKNKELIEKFSEKYLGEPKQKKRSEKSPLLASSATNSERQMKTEATDEQKNRAIKRRKK